jgi:hypothetical protein
VNRRTWLGLGGFCLVLAGLIRLYRLDHFSYGLDEVLEGFWIRGTWAFFWKSLKFDAVHPPLDYLIARMVEQLNPLDWQRKLPDVLYGVGTVAALGALVARRAGRAPGFFAALLLALAPFHVRYSQEFRPHSLGICLMCLSLLALDRFLERPGLLRLVLLYLACLATAYTLYLAAVVLGIAAAGVLIEDAFSTDSERRRSSRRFLRWSPLFGAALWFAYLPWIPVVQEAARRPPPIPAEPLTWARIGRTLSFFAFAHADGDPFRWAAAVWCIPVVAGALLAFRRQGLRFLLIWLVGGLAAVEILGYLHPHWYVTRRFLSAGLVFPVLIAVAIGHVKRTRVGMSVATILLTFLLWSDINGLTQYFREGRADWRPLARFLAVRSASEQIFTENQYAQLCLAYYVCGPDWLFGEAKGYRPISNLECDPVRLTWAWPPGETAWLVLAGEPKCRPLREWSTAFEKTPFPTAEGAVLVHLDPVQRDASLGLKR